MPTTDIEFPAKLRFLFQPARYKVLYGGRGGAKSWGIARALLQLGANRKLRIVCARETMKSIADSVHQLLEDQIVSMGLQAHYEVLKAGITGRNGTEFSFHGLRHNISNIKSLESADILWVEEAANVSKDSWSKVIPTMRKAGSEIWIGFNPELEKDDTYQRFVVKTPPGAVVVKIGWEDNPWFSQTTLPAERAHLLATDPDEEHHVYGGFARNTMAGAIYEVEMRGADVSGRITKVTYDRSKPVHTFWDLGWGDSTSIIMAQAFPFEWRIIDAEEGSGKDITHYLQVLQSRGYVWGTDYLPWDARSSGMLSGRSIEQMMRDAGRTVHVLGQSRVAEGINAARAIFPLCWFDAENCADLLQSLRHYRYGRIEKLNTSTREPVHDWASHFSDAFRTLAVAIQSPEPDIEDGGYRGGYQGRPSRSAWG